MSAAQGMTRKSTHAAPRASDQMPGRKEYRQGRLTRFPNHASSPRTIVVHLPHTPLDLAAMVRALGLPVLAVGAPYRKAVAAARVDIAGIEGREVEFRFERHDAWIKIYRVECARVAHEH